MDISSDDNVGSWEYITLPITNCYVLNSNIIAQSRGIIMTSSYRSPTVLTNYIAIAGIGVARSPKVSVYNTDFGLIAISFIEL